EVDVVEDVGLGAPERRRPERGEAVLDLAQLVTPEGDVVEEVLGAGAPRRVDGGEVLGERARQGAHGLADRPELSDQERDELLVPVVRHGSLRRAWPANARSSALLRARARPARGTSKPRRRFERACSNARARRGRALGSKALEDRSA